VGQVDADKFLFERGTEYLAKKNWLTAREYFRRIVDNYPGSPFRADAKLGVGDSYLGEGQIDALILAVNEFREFLTFFPLSERADYAQYRLTLAQSKQMLRAERDQTATVETLREVQKFVDNYPTSAYRPEVDAIQRTARDRLSESEYRVGRLYFSQRWLVGARMRFEGLLQSDPGFSKKDEVYFYLAETHMRAGNTPLAVQMYERVIAEFPRSKFVEKAQERLKDIKR